MKTIFDHIEHVKGKPHHIRKQIAFGVATLGSALVALVWLVSNYTAGTFAITGSNFAMSTGQEEAVQVVDIAGNQLAGALQHCVVQTLRHILKSSTPPPRFQ